MARNVNMAARTSLTRTMLYRLHFLALFFSISFSSSAAEAEGRHGSSLGDPRPSSDEHQGPAQLRKRPRCAALANEDSRWNEIGDVVVCQFPTIKGVSLSSLPKASRSFGDAHWGKPLRASRKVAASSPHQASESRVQRRLAARKGQRLRPLVTPSRERTFFYRNGVRPHLAAAAVDPLPSEDGGSHGKLHRPPVTLVSYGPVHLVTRVPRISNTTRARRRAPGYPRKRLSKSKTRRHRSYKQRAPRAQAKLVERARNTR